MILCKVKSPTKCEEENILECVVSITDWYDLCFQLLPGSWRCIAGVTLASSDGLEQGHGVVWQSALSAQTGVFKLVICASHYI